MRHRGVVGIAHGQQAAGAQHSPHLAGSVHRARQVLQYLMRMHHIEGHVIEGERVPAARLEAHVGDAARRGVRARLLQHGRHHVQPDDLARRHGARQPGGDRPRPAPEIEQRHPGPQSR